MRPAAGPSLTAAEIEGRLLAQRQLLAAMIGRIAAADADPDALWDWLEAKFVYRDQHEDPGVSPDPAFAIEAASARETRAVIAGAREAFEARRRGPT